MRATTRSAEVGKQQLMEQYKEQKQHWDTLNGPYHSL